MRSLVSLTLTATLAAPLLAGTPAGAPLAAQVVRGVVVDLDTQEPVEGAMVILMDADSAGVDKVLTDGTGAYALDARSAGRFRLRVDRIGFASRVTDLFDVPAEGVFRRVEVPLKVVELAGLDVEGAPRCRVRPEEGQATARVWEEVRKALQAAAWTLRSGVYGYTLMQVERELDPDAREVVHERRRFIRGRGTAPYVSMPAEKLRDEGFVRAHPDSGTTYFAPDAEALLSDPFLDTHCMGLVQGDDGLLGLAFEPVEGRNAPEIEGVLWVDPATAALKRLDFSYVNLADIRAIGHPGGRVLFSALPNGTWIVREWGIRMPVLDIDDRFRRRIYRAGYRDEGGVVWRVVDRTGAVVLEATTASVSGVVGDSVGRPLDGVTVRSVAVGAAARSGADGSFLLPDLLPGPTMLAVEHPSLDSLGLSAPPVTVDAAMGEMVTTELVVPGVAETVSWSCGGGERPVDTSVVLGRVRGADGGAPGDLRVRVTWLDPRPFALSSRAQPLRPGQARGATWTSARIDDVPVFETRLDGGGTFLFCDVPTRSQLLVEIEGPGGATTTRTVTVAPGAAVTVLRTTLDAR